MGDTQDILDGLKWADRVRSRRIARKCDWGNGDDRRLYRANKRVGERSELLDLLAPKRMCPNCGEPRWEVNGWVMGKHMAICHVCFNVLRKRYLEASGRSEVRRETVLRRACRPVPVALLSTVIIEKRGRRCRIDHEKLYRCRTYRGWSQRIVANRVGGLTEKTLGRWERGQVRWVSVAKMEKILGEFRVVICG